MGGRPRAREKELAPESLEKKSVFSIESTLRINNACFTIWALSDISEFLSQTQLIFFGSVFWNTIFHWGSEDIMNGVNSKVSRESMRPTDLKGVMQKEVDISGSPTVQNAVPFELMT